MEFGAAQIFLGNIKDLIAIEKNAIKSF